jgi:hypothetical protein
LNASQVLLLDDMWQESVSKQQALDILFEMPESVVTSYGVFGVFDYGDAILSVPDRGDAWSSPFRSSKKGRRAGHSEGITRVDASAWSPSKFAAFRGLLLVARSGLRPLHLRFLAIHLHDESLLALQARAGQGGCDLSFSARASGGAVPYTRRLRIPMAEVNADLYTMLQRTNMVRGERPLGHDLYTTVFDSLFDGCASARFTKAEAINETVARCHKLLGSPSSLHDFARAVDCFTLVGAVTNATELHAECRKNGIRIAGHCFCNSWSFGASCETWVHALPLRACDCRALTVQM